MDGFQIDSAINDHFKVRYGPNSFVWSFEVTDDHYTGRRTLSLSESWPAEASLSALKQHAAGFAHAHALKAGQIDG